MEVERRRKEASALRDLFHEQWQHLLEVLGVEEDDIPIEEGHELPLEEAIDEIVAGTDARVRAVHHYKNRLRSGSRKLLEHIDDIVEQISGPIKLSRQGFVYDPQVSSLLGSMDEVRRLCDESDEIHKYLKSIHPSEQKSFFALLFMHYHEKEIFGDEIRGDFIHRDVRQISVYFSGLRLLAPSACELDARFTLKHILLDDVVEYLKSLLSRERRDEAKQTDLHNLSDSMDSLNNPLRYLDELVTILELPLNLICLEENSVCVNKMGIKVSNAERACDEIHLQEVEIGGNHSTLLTLVEIAFADVS